MLREQLISHVLETPLEGIPQQAMHSAQVFLEDSLAVGLAGSRAAAGAPLLAAVQRWGHGDAAACWGHELRLPAPAAALVNSFQIHCQEFDCVHEPAVVHPMAVIVGALMAEVEACRAHTPVSGQSLLAALVLAVDAATLLGICARAPMRFFRPAMCGGLGATLALARLRGLDTETSARALGLMHAQLAGTLQAHVEGTPVLALQIGFAARAAHCAVDLAAMGMAAPLDVLEGPYGYLPLFEGEYECAPSLQQLGKVWQVTRLSHKPWPTGRAAHGALSALSEFLAEGGDAGTIRRMQLTAPPLIARLVDRPWPDAMSVSYARLCLPFLIGCLLRDGRLGLASFDEPRLVDRELREQALPLCVLVDTSADANALNPQILQLQLADGSTWQRHVAVAPGHPDAPLTAAARQAKFAHCLHYAQLAPPRIHALTTALRDLARSQDAATLIDAMHGDTSK